MADTANNALTTNFNVTPYYDDYDVTKGYHRILYKPGFAVQARELTQMQTILQNQIDKFGRHFFDEGAIVVPGLPEIYIANNFSSVGPTNYVKVSDYDSSGANVSLSQFEGITLRGVTSGVNAVVSVVIDGSEISQNTKTLYVDYSGASNANASIVRFSPGETLTSNTGNLIVLAAANSIGYGSLYRISAGVVFSKGHFISFPAQEVVLDRYNPSPTCKVGFKVTETIVSSAEDNSLLDPALEASNYSAPGADRFKLEAELQVRPIDDIETVPNFVALFSVKDDIIQTYVDKTEYSIVRDEFARRTFDESGDYYVSGLNVDMRELRDTGTNGGVYANGNSSLLFVKVDPGTAYVKGYEVKTRGPTILATEKSTEYANVQNQIASAFLGSYVTVDEIVGTLELDKIRTVDLYDTARNRISTGVYTASPLGNKIGEARVASFEYNSGVLGTPDGRCDLYLLDVQMTGSNSFSTVKSVYISDTGFGADIVLSPITGTAVLSEPFNSAMLYYTGSDYTRRVRNGLENISTLYYYNSSIPITVQTTGTFSATVSADELAYTGPLSTTDKRELFLTLDTSVNVAYTGTVSSNTQNTVFASGGTSFNRFNVGDKVEFSGLNDTYTIISANSTQMIIDRLPAGTLSGNSIFKAYKAGDYIDLTTLGSGTGEVRSVEASSSTQLDINLKETFPTTVGGTITVRTAKRNAGYATKTLRPNRYVRINCASHPSTTNGPYSLGFSDVFRIKSIIKKSGSYPTSNTDGTNVTTSFILDNGQRDTHYDTAKITPINSLQSTDRLLVEFDYFEPVFTTSKGHFTLQSYPVNDNSSASDIISTAEIPVYKSPTTGNLYDLRNHLDFRPMKTSVATDQTDPTLANENPAVSTTYHNESSPTGLNLVAPSSEISFDYTYYLARRDVLHINKDQVFTITKGTPSAFPLTPEISDNEMILAILNIAPYPSISPYYAKLINRQEISCSVKKVAPIRHTMREIGVMKERIQNLEYYAALSLLEKSAVDLLIQDENGDDRFKNGIFVDTFTDHLLGATYNTDYRIVVDPEEKSIRPLYSMLSINYDYLSGTGVEKNGDLITLDYTEVEYANVPFVTTSITTEKSSAGFVGNITLAPAEDVWVETGDSPAPLIVNINDANLDGLQDAQQQGGVTVTWNAWQTKIVGYKVYRGTGAKRTLVGTFLSPIEAERAAQNARTLNSGATIETLYENNRTGTESFNYLDTDSVSLGSRVVNTEVIPYIRAQTLMGSVTGLKPFAKFSVFFDGIYMSPYVRPITEAEFNDTTSLSAWEYNEGDDLFANANGELWFRLRIPNDSGLRFPVGQKNVLITDSLTNSEIASSFAETSFFAQGVTQTKQETILSTRQVDVRQRTLVDSTNSSTFSTLPRLPPPPPPPPRPESNRPENGGGGRPEGPGITVSNGHKGCCLAYVMPIKSKSGEEGIFLTSVEVYCEQKHPTLGVWFEIRELDAGGGITGNQVPFSEKWYKSSEVPLSTDGRTNGLRVTFDSPVFLYSDKSYAFIIHPEASNPNYYFWASRLRETDRNTGQQVTSRAFFGTLFTTNNDTIWVPVDLVDLTCKWYRASFVSSGSFIIGNKKKEKLYLNDIVGTMEGVGEPFVSGDIITLTGYSGPAITANDFIVGNSSGVNSRIALIDSGKYAMSNIRYQSGEAVTVRFASNAAVKGSGGSISAIENGRGTLEYYKDATRSVHMILSDSNGKFSVGSRVFDISDEGNARIDRIENMRYSLIDFEPTMLSFAATSTAFDMSLRTNTASAVTGIRVEAGENYEFGQEMAIFSRSNEEDLSIDRSNKVTVSMSTFSDYLSPVFDLAKTQSIIVDNIVNSNTVGESAASGGNLFNKYISKIVTLAEDQDAEDLKVYLTAYRPPNTDVKVWLKILNGDDSDTMEQRPWIELEKSYGGGITYSSVSDKNDFKEYTYNIPASYMTSPTIGAVQYVNSQGITLTRFKSFQVKIGLLATNSAVIPRVADLRTIAVQM